MARCSTEAASEDAAAKKKKKKKHTKGHHWEELGQITLAKKEYFQFFTSLCTVETFTVTFQ